MQFSYIMKIPISQDRLAFIKMFTPLEFIIIPKIRSIFVDLQNILIKFQCASKSKIIKPVWRKKNRKKREILPKTGKEQDNIYT